MGKKADQGEKSEFEKASEKTNAGLLGEFWEFLKESKKWWLIPTLLALLLLGGLVILGGTGLAPFIYSLF